LRILDKGFIDLIDHMGDDNTVVSAARVSVLGHTKGEIRDGELIRYLLDNNHTSPFEHVTFQFLVKCPIFVARQWMRHRTWSYNEVSRRYTSDNIEFYIPNKLRRQSIGDKQMSEGTISALDARNISKDIEDHVSDSCYLYRKMITYGIAREQARMVLPTNLYTSFYATVDLHNLFHFMKLRNHPHAQEEVRVYAEAMESLIEPIVPISLGAWKTIIKGGSN